MSLADDYARQFAWRDWPRVLEALPPLDGRTVLDLGCGVGDLAAEFVARGARVIGFDGNEELLAAARTRGLAGAEFVQADLRALPDLGVIADGVFCSFAAAYLTDLAGPLAAWKRVLRGDGWIAVVEIDDLFGHEPLGAHTRSLFEGYAREALAAGRYDFHMGRKLRGYLEAAGFRFSTEAALADAELSFDGPARPDVLDGWRARLNRMTLLHDFCGAAYSALRDDFLGCLARDDHRSRARVILCVAEMESR